MKSTSLVLLMLISASLVGCARQTIGDFCDVSNPIRVSPQTAASMSQAEKRDVLKHNEYGERACGWRASR